MHLELSHNSHLRIRGILTIIMGCASGVPILLSEFARPGRWDRIGGSAGSTSISCYHTRYNQSVVHCSSQ